MNDHFAQEIWSCEEAQLSLLVLLVWVFAAVWPLHIIPTILSASEVLTLSFREIPVVSLLAHLIILCPQRNLRTTTRSIGTRLIRQTLEPRYKYVSNCASPLQKESIRTANGILRYWMFSPCWLWFEAVFTLVSIAQFDSAPVHIFCLSSRCVSSGWYEQIHDASHFTSTTC